MTCTCVLPLQAGNVIHSDVVILDSGRCNLNLQVDNAFVKHLQRSSLAADSATDTQKVGVTWPPWHVHRYQPCMRL